jgi:hypothetical protein
MLALASSCPALVLPHAPAHVHHARAATPAVVMRMPWEPVPAEPEPEAPPQEVRINTLCLHTIIY